MIEEYGNENYIASLGEFQRTIAGAITRFRENKILQRIRNHDHSVWQPEPTEITNRLGWLYSPQTTMKALDEINDFVEDVRGSGFTNALLLGMGGSSLAAEVFRLIFGVKKRFLDLEILDSTDPGVVLEYAKKFDPQRTLYLVSTKSGSTVETISFMKFFYNHVQSAVGENNASRHFVAITDPGSPLEETARSLKFRKIFLNDPNIGGRFSALSFFGIVPAALVGIDLQKLLQRAQEMVDYCEIDSENRLNSCAHFGVALGELAKAGTDKLTMFFSGSFKAFGAWAEQLIAESTGKEGKGILPVDGEAIAAPEKYARDRVFVYLRKKDEHELDRGIDALKNAEFPVIEITLDDVYDLGAEFYRWEMATAIVSWSLNINPFNQPNVESAKNRAREMTNLYKETGKLPDESPSIEQDGIKFYGDTEAGNPGQALGIYLSKAISGVNYVAMQAYLKPFPKLNDALHRLRTMIQKELRIATTVGYGPRFLHSTGQLHKGDAGNGLFIQLTADMPNDVPIPDEPGSDKSSISFGILKTAQFQGDRQALQENGRKVIRIDLGADPVQSIKKLTEIL
ncbi:glucose-6-phosphate isomerase [candidate division KSB1 bacterium]|nr:glucose-6-phosphate isomerase [candidate division KSB1 bacterium]